MYPIQYSVYKGTGGKHGAVQFSLQDPHFFKGKEKDFTGAEALDDNRRTKEGWKSREGNIFLEITSAKDKNVYDWDKKIVMALSITDIGKILMTLLTGDECKIMHDPGAKSESAGVIKKFLNISSPNGTKAGVIISASKTSGGETTKHTVPLTGDEVLVLRQLLQAAIPKALAWQ